MDNNKGSLILKALSPEADAAQIIAYLEKRAKSIPADKIPLILNNLPVVLSRNVAEETGQLVIERLRELGAVALFLPFQERGEEKPASDAEAAADAGGETVTQLPPMPSPRQQALLRFKEVNKELWIVLSMLAIAWMLNYTLASRYLLLGFYTLPAVVSAYLFGRRQAVLTAFVSILLVGLVSYFNPHRFDVVQLAGIGGDNQWYHIISWGCILLVTAYTMGTLYERNKNKMEELRQTYQGLLLILRHFVAQDEDKENHCFRVSIYATRIAAAMGLEKEAIEDIRSAALLHDIGHLKISRSILSKAARLNRLPSVDNGLVESHPLSGPMGRILPLLLGQHPQVDAAVDNEEATAPIGARILSVADAFDRLTIGTPDQPALSAQEAKIRIQEEGEAAYDPAVVKAFAAAVDRLDMELPSIIL